MQNILRHVSEGSPFRSEPIQRPCKHAAALSFAISFRIVRCNQLRYGVHEREFARDIRIVFVADN